MNATSLELLDLSSDELVILAGSLESERCGLLIGIRHAHQRTFRDELRHRLTGGEAGRTLPSADGVIGVIGARAKHRQRFPTAHVNRPVDLRIVVPPSDANYVS